MVVACLALFLTLGGVGYAAATINGSSIKNGTITPSKIKSRSLSGTQFRANGIGGPSIKESTLGEVPKAKAAASATNATNATNSTNATTAKNAESLGGVAASGYTRYGAALPAGQTVSGAFGCYQEDDTAVTDCTSVASLPVPATGTLADNTVNFAASSGSFNATDADGTCTGNVNAPTAPPGKVCLYISTFATSPAAQAVAGQANIITGTNGASARGFEVDLTSVAATTKSVNIEGVWAYTAP
jgi:hypothetical protein